MATVLKSFPKEYSHLMNKDGTSKIQSEDGSSDYVTLFQELDKLEDKLTEKGYQFWSTPVADSQATYIIRKTKPVVLQWVPNPDGYRASPAELRGLRTEDVMRQLEWQNLWKNIYLNHPK